MLTKNQLNSSKRAKHFKLKNIYFKLLFTINLLKKMLKIYFSLEWPQPALEPYNRIWTYLSTPFDWEDKYFENIINEHVESRLQFKLDLNRRMRTSMVKKYEIKLYNLMYCAASYWTCRSAVQGYNRRCTNLTERLKRSIRSSAVCSTRLLRLNIRPGAPWTPSGRKRARFRKTNS